MIIHYMMIWTRKALYNKQVSDELFYPGQSVTENIKLKLTEVA